MGTPVKEQGPNRKAIEDSGQTVEEWMRKHPNVPLGPDSPPDGGAGPVALSDAFPQSGGGLPDEDGNPTGEPLIEHPVSPADPWDEENRRTGLRRHTGGRYGVAPDPAASRISQEAERGEPDRPDPKNLEIRDRVKERADTAVSESPAPKVQYAGQNPRHAESANADTRAKDAEAGTSSGQGRTHSSLNDQLAESGKEPPSNWDGMTVQEKQAWLKSNG